MSADTVESNDHNYPIQKTGRNEQITVLWKPPKLFITYTNTRISEKRCFLNRAAYEIAFVNTILWLKKN
jgi:hypothetical protein